MPEHDINDMAHDERIVEIDYTNWRGERGMRTIIPIRLSFESSEWHPHKQWVLVAWDEDKHAERSFALADIHSWKASAPSANDEQD